MVTFRAFGGDHSGDNLPAIALRISSVRSGEIVAEGTPEKVAEVEGSFTGHYLKPMLERATPDSAGKKKQPEAAE